MAVFLWVLAVCIVLLWLFLRPGRYGEAQKQLVYGVNHAHRGLHTKDKTVPENSLPAFRAAAEAANRKNWYTHCCFTYIFTMIGRSRDA